MKPRTPEQLDRAMSYEQVLGYFVEGSSTVKSYKLGSLTVKYSVVHLPEGMRPLPSAATIAAGGDATENRPVVILSDDVPVEVRGPWAVSEQLASEIAHLEVPNPRLMAEQAVIGILKRENPIYWTKYAEARAEYLNNLAHFISSSSDRPVDISDCTNAASFLVKQAEHASSI